MFRLILLFLVLPILGFSQVTSTYSTVDRRTKIYAGESVQTFDFRKIEDVEQYFLTEHWLLARLIDNEGEVGKDQYYLKYDILNNEVNVNVNNANLVAPKSMVSGFVYLNIDGNNTYFLALKPDNWNKGATYFEVLEDGKFKLLKYHYTKTSGGYYNAAVDAGSLNKKIVPKTNLYILEDDNNIYKVPAKKRARKKFFEKYEVIKNYLSKNKVNLKNEEAIAELVQIFNKQK